MNRTCNICEVEKPLEEFAKGKKYKDGRRPTCSTCWNAIMRARRKVVVDPNDKWLFVFIERVHILSTHGYSPRKIYELLTTPF